MKYRYITCGTCSINDKLSDFRIIGASNLGSSTNCIRVTLPDDVELEKWSCDPYATTNCDRLISEFNPIVMVRLNRKLVLDKDLTKKFLDGTLKPSEIYKEMQKKGFRDTLRFGYLNSAQSKFYSHFIGKIWQLDKIPNVENPIDYNAYEYLFVADTDYKKVYGKYIEALRAYINKTPELDYMKKLSDIEVMDLYAKICFSQMPPYKLYDLSEVNKDFLKHEFMDSKRFFIHLFI